MTEQRRPEATDGEASAAASETRPDEDDAATRRGEDDAAGPAEAERAAYDTVEEAVRKQLTKALGGPRGVVEAAIPTIGFTVSWIVSHKLQLSLGIGAGLAVVLLAVRLAQRSTVQFVLNSIFGIAIAAFFALRSGKAADAFLPGILYNAGYAAAMLLSIVVRWPVVGFLIGSVTGDPTAWHRDRDTVRLCSRLTWLLLIPCLVRVAVQYPLYLAGHVGWLGASKVVLGWPLQVAALAAMVWVLARGRTPMEPATGAPKS
ncbi:DUF3159 domain-containing protein [Actinoallomurus sp. NPDC050550]|uniref:DUF3159 domain-containing protein n=1 Tax=Actinoallomurus sp. NPDC050550 TaxID=3154937 RepID=UPI003400E3A9